jgi:ribosomal protein L28
MKRKLKSKGEQQPTVDNKDQLLSPPEAASQLRVCTATLRRMEKRGLLHPARLSKRCVRYPLRQLLRLIAEAQ